MLFPHPLEIRARRRRIICIALAFVFLAGLLVFMSLPTEPRYQGRCLSDWLQDYSNPLGHVHSRRELATMDLSRSFEESSRAVKAIGTNAIPSLLKWVQAKDSRPKRVLLVLTEHNPALRDHLRSEKEQHDMAQAGFMILQREALPAVPGLIALTKHSDPEVRLRAFEFLIILEAPNFNNLVPVLVPFGRDPDPENRRKAAEHMQLLLHLISPEEAKKTGVYEAFPEFRPSETNALQAR